MSRSNSGDAPHPPIDVQSLLNHEFEYYVWFRGHSHRLRYQRHEAIDEVIGHFIVASGAGEAGDPDRVYVFRDFELWLTLTIRKWDMPGRREFIALNHWLHEEESFVVEFGDTFFGPGE